jgi:uncharacterized protein (TIGR03118 family)
MKTHLATYRCYKIALVFGLAAGSLAAQNTYLVHNLVSDLPNMADHQDKNLVNPWGNAFSATSPFWIGNNGTGTSTLYNTSGTPNALVVAVPGPTGSKNPGAVTGVLVNGNTSVFQVAAGKQAQFLFCTEDGTVSGWNSTVNSTNALVMVDNSGSGAIYKGCAIGGTTAAPQIYSANFNAGTIDVVDANFKTVKTTGGFANPKVPAGFAPFNIQNIGGQLFVTYAQQDSKKHDDVAGLGNGFVAVFDMNGTLVSNLIANGALNSPWGMAMAPASFGAFHGALLVSNFGDGMIHAYNPATGAQLGTLNDNHNNPIAVPGMWSINFGNGGNGGDPATLYFTAGIGGGPNNDPLESHGLFGSIQAVPNFVSAGIQNGASFTGSVAPNTWVTIKGGGLAATTRNWLSGDFVANRLPIQLDGVSVTVNGEAAYVGFISPMQVNFLVPSDLQAGPMQITVTNNGLTSAAVTGTLVATAPAFFTIGAADKTTNNLFIAAEHANGSVAGPPSLVTGVTTTPFNAGETMVLYATGLGPTSPATPNGQLFNSALPLPALPTVTVGGQTAKVSFAGLVSPGLYQLNVVLPSGTAATAASGTVAQVPVVLQAAGAQSQASVVVAVPAGQ